MNGTLVLIRIVRMDYICDSNVSLLQQDQVRWDNCVPEPNDRGVSDDTSVDGSRGRFDYPVDSQRVDDFMGCGRADAGRRRSGMGVAGRSGARHLYEAAAGYCAA